MEGTIGIEEITLIKFQAWEQEAVVMECGLTISLMDG